MFPQVGVVEVLLICVAGLFSFAIPVASLVLLLIIYNKLSVLEKRLKSKDE